MLYTKKAPEQDSAAQASSIFYMFRVGNLVLSACCGKGDPDTFKTYRLEAR